MKIVKEFIIKAYKLDGVLDKFWKCILLKETSDYFVFKGVFEKTVNHRFLGIIESNTFSYEIYWKNKPFNVFIFYNPDNSFKCFYCNINLIPQVESNTLKYTDLEIDLIVWEDFKVQLVDLGDFFKVFLNHNERDDLIELAESAISEILSMIVKKEFPFDLVNINSQKIIVDE